MIYTSRWKILLIIAVCVIGLFYAVPNVIGKDARAWMEANLPSWMPHQTVNLGLDLQGGSHLLLQVDLASVVRDRSEGVGQAARPELRKQKIGYTQIAPLPEGGLRIKLRDAADGEKARKVLRATDRDMDVTMTDGGKTLEARYTDAAIKAIKDKTIDQSIEIVRRRVDESGTKEPVIQRQGDDRIIVQLPGLDNPEHVKNLLGRTAKLSFHLVGGQGEGGSRMLPMQGKDEGMTVPIQRQAMLTGDMLVDAQANFSEGRPIVSFSLNAIGAKRFCDVTRANVQKPFAIVLDEKVISAPNINEAICGGSAQISGDFSVQEVNDLALLLRAGALPAPLIVLEERTVGPSLGADSVQDGKRASIYGFCFVVMLVLLVYGLFGVFATVALVVNMILLFALLSALQATLTLPGIAGIVLTMGLAVDANVLIFERIKEELRSGRSVVSAIDSGFRHAMSSIVDANLTSLISAFILMSFGTGPVKGFAVTLLLGTLTSLFCSIMLTRLIITIWVNWKKPATISA
jgi:preprotein translocase subunit SecD